MSRGFGRLQYWLLGCIGNEPMTFEQILAQAYPEGSFEGDMAKVLGSSNVSPTRSLRRALGKLCDAGVIQIMGRRPHRYRLDPLLVRGGAQHNPDHISLIYRCLKDEEGASLSEKDANLGRMLRKLESAMPPRAGSDKDKAGRCSR
jgi:hypothetical protein